MSSVLVIDCGGTFTNFTVLSPSTSLYSINIPTISYQFESNLLSTINSLHTQFMFSHVVIGLPGPVNSSSHYVYCPPMDQTIDIRILNSSLFQIHIVNDLVAHVLLHRVHLLTGSCTAYLTIGTSFGLASFSSIPDLFDANLSDSLSSIHTFEIAHVLCSNFPFLSSSLAFDFSSLASNITLSSIFSVGGFFRCTTAFEPKEFRGHIPIINTFQCQYFSPLIDLHLAEQWYLSLKLVIESYFSMCDQPSPSRFYLSGGLTNILFQYNPSALSSNLVHPLLPIKS